MSTTTIPFFPSAHKDRIIGHMNEDHSDAILNYARHFGGLADASAARLDDLDQSGMDITVTLPGGEVAVRVGYARPLDTPADAHHVLVEMAQTAGAALAGPAPRKEDALGRAREAATRLRANMKTVILGTVSPAGEPDASVAAAVLGEDGAFYVYVSGLSLHTRNLLETAKASVLIIQDEAAAKQLLARQRLTFPCAASLVERGSAEFQTRMTALKGVFGPVMEHLEGMVDFRLFRLAPGTGRLVAGFGQAYDVNPSDWTRLGHVNDTGHTPANPHLKS